MRHPFIYLLFLSTLVGFMTEPIQEIEAQQINAGYDRPTPFSNQSRSVVLSRHGMVATSHPLAAQVGVDILQQGGNAVDAAIAVNAMLGVVEPMSCGIGGDLFAIYWDAKKQKLYGLNASGRSPYAATLEHFQELGLDYIPITGPLGWSVPGCVSGWDKLQHRFGNLALSDVLTPSIHTAREGFPVTEVIAGSWRGSESALKQYADSAATFLLNGSRAPGFGEIFKNPNLANSYQLIAEQGADALYRGAIAKAIIRYSEAHGGLFSMKDFKNHTADWIDPVSTNYRGYDVWELPPNGQGIAALQILNLLEPYDVRSMGPGSPDYLHLFTEAKKLAFADRAKFYADIDASDVPVAELISKEYAKRRGTLIDMARAADDVPAGDPRLQHGDTVYLTVVDKDRNCCSLIQSNYYGFGSDVVPGNVGFALQNRGALFALDEDHLNGLEPHKRPFHTIIPAMVTKDGKPWFCFGVMGGDMQPQGHVQVLINMIDFGMNVQQAGDAARIRHIGSAQPTGKPADGSGVVHIETGISDPIAQELEKRGHRIVRSVGGFGGYQGILIDHDADVLHGATEPRKDGAAIGY